MKMQDINQAVIIQIIRKNVGNILKITKQHKFNNLILYLITNEIKRNQ